MDPGGAGHTLIHYLDEFLMFEPHGEREYLKALDRALAMCTRLRVPIAAHKTEGPTQVLTFLGIEVDTKTQQIRLPTEKLRRLLGRLRVGGAGSPVPKELLSLVGQLQHACCVVRVILS